MPTYTVREHPFGEAGIRSSLEEVAARASEPTRDAEKSSKSLEQAVQNGKKLDIMKRWTAMVLRKAKDRGEKVNTDRARASVILRAAQQKIWIPDPVHAEFMAAAHYMACMDPDLPCYEGGDCDDLTIFLGAAFIAVGLHTAIVGHAYNAKHQISHVLTAVRVDGKWFYADPSSDFPLGKAVPHTWERWYSIPNIQVVCDAARCLRSGSEMDPEQLNFVDKGIFVGVSGPPAVEMAERFRWLEEPVEELPPPVDIARPWCVGQQPAQETTQAQGFSTIEKILLASVLISATSLVVHVVEMQDARPHSS